MRGSPSAGGPKAGVAHEAWVADGLRSPVTVIANELVWAPEGGPGASGAHPFWLSEVAADEYFRSGKYSVPHYPHQAMGRAFGPLALDQTLMFCQILQERIKQQGCVAVCTPRGSLAGRANAAVLMGAFLLFRRGWTLKQLVAQLPQEAEASFPCSWAGNAFVGTPQPDLMTVGDCWAGLYLARNRGWLPLDAFEDRLKLLLACGQYRRMVLEYDASWIWPGRVLVAADPMSTIKDPNPETCSSLQPGAAKVSMVMGDEWCPTPIPSPPENAWSPLGVLKCVGSGRNLQDLDAGSCSDATVSEVVGQRQKSVVSNCPTARGGAAMGKEQECEMDVIEMASSCHTVCKGYGFSRQESAPDAQPEHHPKDFISWCQDRGVALIVRVNRGDESGLLEHGGSYEPKAMVKNGIAHLDLPVPDKNGGVPDARSIHCMLQRAAVEGLSLDGPREREPAVLVHCKGGFGRSIVFACCLLIWEHDIPGRSLLGWVRIVRPGAITTPQQERFLCRLSGRADLQRYVANSNPACCTVS